MYAGTTACAMSVASANNSSFNSVVHVVEKDATNASAFASVLDHEVIVRPLLESRVIFRIVLIARAFQRPVKVSVASS